MTDTNSKDVKNHIIALGLNSLIKSYQVADKALAVKYIQENIQDIPDMLEFLDDKVILEVLKEHKEDFKIWLKEKREESQVSLGESIIDE